MAHRLSAFKTPEDAARYLDLYDAFVADLWPVPHDEIDVASRFGSTHVRRSRPSGSSDHAGADSARADEGLPFVLINPTSGGSLGWYSVIALFAAHHTVFTPDTIGTAGRSIQAVPVTSETDLSRWLDDVLDGLGLDRVHLVGYSEGGWIGATHAALTRQKERLATLTLIEPGGAIERISTRMMAGLIVRAMGVLRARDKATALRDFNRWMNGDIELSDEEIELVLHVFKTFRQRLPRPSRLSEDELRCITVPTLLMLAEDSRVIDPQKVAARARRLMPDVTVDVAPNAGHGLLFQDPERVTDRIVAFVDEVERRQRASTS